MFAKSLACCTLGTLATLIKIDVAGGWLSPFGSWASWSASRCCSGLSRSSCPRCRLFSVCGWRRRCTRGAGVGTEAEPGPNVTCGRGSLLARRAFPFSALERVPGSWYSLGSGCVINNACSADDSGVLNGSPSSFSSSSSSKIVVLCLLRVGGRMSSSGSSSYS